MLASFIALLHLTPGFHALAHDGHDSVADRNVAAIELDCDACATLSATRRGISASPAPIVLFLPAPVAFDSTHVEQLLDGRFLPSSSPRAPPLA
ncbi:MAG: hypothetical protein ACQGVK_05715 [Myxococcota bacterium]